MSKITGAVLLLMTGCGGMVVADISGASFVTQVAASLTFGLGFLVFVLELFLARPENIKW